jgi:hypothetical protein
MRKIIVILFVGVFLAVAVSSVYAAEAFLVPSELIQYDQDKAFNGYTLFAARNAGGNAYLIDMLGNVVRFWPRPEGWTPEKTERLIDNGNLIRAIRPPGTSGGTGSLPSTFQQLDWNGNIVWEFTDPRGHSVSHHNYKRIFNPKLNEYTLLYIATLGTAGSGTIFLSNADAVAGGLDPAGNYPTLRPDGLVEVDMDGNIIWEWWSWDHIVQEENAAWPNFGVVADTPGRMDMNFGRTPRGDFVHFNSLDYNEELDQVVGNASTVSEFWVIDHGGTFIPGDPAGSIALAAGPAGDFIYRWGNPCAYDAGECPSRGETSSDEGDQKVHFSHDIQWIREQGVRPQWNLPGAGNFLIFDNGSRRAGTSRSALVEVNPYDGDWRDGVYLPEASDQIVFSFTSIEPNSFYSRNISGTQRLPNGNTLGISGRMGHIFEVTPEGEVVWEYNNPVLSTQADTTVVEQIPDGNTTALFTAHRYPPDHPALLGRSLVPVGTLTGRVPLSDSGEKQVEFTGFGFSGQGIGGGGVGDAGGPGGAGGY